MPLYVCFATLPLRINFVVCFTALGRFSGEADIKRAVAGEIARLKCDIDGLPQPAITWEKDRGQLPISPRYTHWTVALWPISLVALQKSAGGNSMQDTSAVRASWVAL